MRKNHRTLVSLVCAATMILNMGMPVATVNAETIEMAESDSAESDGLEETQVSGSNETVSTSASDGDNVNTISEASSKSISESNTAENSNQDSNETTSTENSTSTGSLNAVQNEETASSEEASSTTSATTTSDAAAEGDSAAEENTTETTKENATESGTEAGSEETSNAVATTTDAAVKETTEKDTTEASTGESTKEETTKESTEETTEAATEETTEDPFADLPTEEELDAQIEEEEAAVETKDETANVTGAAKCGDSVIVGYAAFSLNEGELKDQAKDIDGYTFNGGITLDGVEVSKVYSEVEEKTESREYSIRVDSSDETEEGSAKKAEKETVTRDVVTEKTRVTKAETADGTITISGDKTVVFTYDENHTTTTLTAKYVDEFGDSIGQNGENVSVPFADGKDELTLKDSFPDKLQIAQDDSGKKVREYTYESTYIKENGSNVAVTEVKRIHIRDDRYAYLVKKEGSDEFAELQSDTTLYVRYNDGKKQVYTYTDDDNTITVTATLQHADAIPDDARLVVTQITPETEGYNYDAYMEALNNSDTSMIYDASNTLLYDIAFLGNSVDADGNIDTSKTIEYEPVNGSVSIRVEFKKNQLSDELNAENAEAVQVTHLPLKDEVRDSVVSTKDATTISVDDIETEPVDADVSLEGTDTTSFSLSELSAVAYTYNSVNYESELEDFLRSVDISGDGISYNETSKTYTVLPDKDYQFSLTFTEPSLDGNNAQFDNLDNTNSAKSLTYQLPAGLAPVLSNDPYSGTFDIKVKVDGTEYTLEGNTYTLSNTGKLTINWNTASTNYEIFKKASNASFKLTFAGRFSFTEDETTIQFNSEVSKTVKIDRTTQADISKSAEFDPETGKANFTVDLKGIQGTSTGVVVTDTMLGTALTLDPNSIVVKDSDGNIVDSATYTKSIDGNNFTLSGLSVPEGKHVYIRYTAAVDKTRITGNGNWDETNNKVSFHSDKQNPGKETSTDLSNKIKYSSLTKTSGTPTGADGQKIVPWTITFNKDKYVNASNVVITDTIDSSSQSYMKYTEDGIHVKETDSDGKVTESNVSWTDSGMSKTDTSWAYTIPTTDKNASYEITYNTVVDNNKFYADTTVKNTVDDGHTPGFGDQTSGTATIAPGKGTDFDIAKTGTANGTDSITWTVTLTRPDLGCDDAYVVDTLPSCSIQKADGNWETVYDGMPSSKENIKVTGLQDGESWSYTPNEDNKSGFKITFYKDAAQTTKGLNKPVNNEKTITVTYTSSVNSDWLAYTENHSSTKTHTNKADFNVGNGHKNTDSSIDIVPSGTFKILKKLYAGRTENNENLQNVADDGTVYFPFQIAITGIDGSKELVIDDTFDTDNLEFYSTDLSINNSTYKYNGSVYLGNTWSFWDNPLSVNVSRQDLYDSKGNKTGIRFTITKEDAKTLADKAKNTQDPAFYICYCLKLKDAKAFDTAHENQSAAFTNTASTEDGTSSASVEFNYKSEPITKSETQSVRLVDGIYVADYQIVVNPLGQDYASGKDTLEVTDTPSENLVILPDTIKYNGVSTQNFRTQGSNYIFTIPDGQKCVITYQARLKVTKSGDYTYSNTASIEGKPQTNTKNTKNITFTGSASGDASMCSVKLHKYYEDGEQSHSLAGARFALYTNAECTEYAMDGNGDYLLSSKKNKNDTAESGVETGSDGYLTINNLTPNSSDGKTTYDYYLKEISAPKGYAVLSAPIHFQISSDLNINFIGDAPSGVTQTGGYGLYLEVKDDVKKIELPQTGGRGVKWLYTLGMLLVFLPVTYKFALRRKRERGDET